MIGGIDVRLRSSAGQESLEAAVRAVRQVWPKAAFENATSGERYSDFSRIPFGGISELFVYRDAGSAAVWDREGAVERAYNTMIHLIHDPGLITAVVDDQTGEVAVALDAIRSALDDTILSIPALLSREAA
ncbi:MAG TPA: hypothetical protein VHV55_09450 [Pirellulales bacterium]|jgi:hypothetical protein|nr:hypothetical protein [Pirellulales bacterium]